MSSQHLVDELLDQLLENLKDTKTVFLLKTVFVELILLLCN